MKKQKKINPYKKKVARKKFRITRTHWIAGICVLAVVATLVCFKLFYDPHAGHDHSTPDANGHYEGDGHDHSHDTGNTAQSTDKVKYQVYTNADNTYRLVFRDTANKVIANFDKLPKQPIKAEIDKTKGIYEMGWATGDGGNEFECVYYNEKTGQVSKQFHAPRGTDGVRIAYGSPDQTKIIVEELFNSKGYHKEYDLENAYSKNGNIISGGKLQADKKTVLISYYINDKGETGHAAVKLYE